MKMILIEDLQAGMELAQDIFESQDSSSPISRKGIILTDYVIKRMKKIGIRGVYIVSDLGEDFPIQQQTSLVIDKKLREDALHSLEDMFAAASIKQEDVHASSAQIVKRIDSVVDGLMTSLLTKKDALINISDLKSFDDYTYHHSLSVAVLSLSLGQYLGYNNTQLNDLGMCAMMHDIGKTAIPVEIIRKPSKLNAHEFDLIKTHSFAGFDYLQNSSIGNEDLWHGVLHHHEKVDGTGYPHGLKGNQIPEWSRIIAVADVYDALTSNRPYRQPMQPSDAIEYIMGGSGSAFDFDIVSGLVKKIDLYPIGSTLELSDGRMAKVLNNENQMRPIVCLAGTGEVMDLFRDRQCLSIVVKKMIKLAA